MQVYFVGGCHLVGKPHGVQHGFVRRLWKRWRLEKREVHFVLIPYAVSWGALFKACREALESQPDILIINIQAGLVLPTWERTLKRRGIGKGPILSDAVSNPTENWFAPMAWKYQDKSKLYWILKALAILLLGGHRENWEYIEENWAELAESFARSSGRVIVMTPTPARAEYFVRGVANLERVREMVLRHVDKYEVCDVYPVLKKMGTKALWLDGQHLSIEGHSVVAEKLWEMLKVKGADT